jgi:hypothetical protein
MKFDFIYVKKSFLGVVSNLKANNSIQIVNFSNRFSMTGMSTTVSFDPPVPNNGVSPPAAREFKCGSDICSSEVALAGLNLATPSAVPITSLSMLYPGLGYSGGDNGALAFNIVAVTLGILGVILTGHCIAVLIILRRNAKQQGEKGGVWGKQASLKWWNKIPMPNFGASELSAGPGPYDTVELPGEGGPVFELSAGSIHKSSKRSSKRSRTSVLSQKSNGIIIEENVRPGAQVATSEPANMHEISATEAETLDESPAGETTAMLINRSPGLSTSSNSPQRTLHQSPAEEPSQAPAITISAPPIDKARSRELVGFFAPRVTSETEMRVLEGVMAPLPPRRPRENGKWVYK